MEEEKLFKSIVEKSKLTREAALELGKKVNKGIYEKYNKKLKNN